MTGLHVETGRHASECTVEQIDAATIFISERDRT
jgi:hypothetical protein